MTPDLPCRCRFYSSSYWIVTPAVPTSSVMRLMDFNGLHRLIVAAMVYLNPSVVSSSSPSVSPLEQPSRCLCLTASAGVAGCIPVELYSKQPELKHQWDSNSSFFGLTDPLSVWFVRTVLPEHPLKQSRASDSKLIVQLFQRKN